MSFFKEKKIISFAILFFLFSPISLFAQVTGAPPPPNTGITYECPPTPGPDGKPVYGNCTFQDLINAIQKALNWGRNFALTFSVIVLAYAGWKYMISGDRPAERSKANEMLRKVAIGIFLILAAWLIVTLILKALGVTTPGVTFN